MDPVYAEIVKKTSGYTAKGVKGFFEEMYETEFASLKVEGSTVTFLDDKGASLGALTYESKGTRKRTVKMGGREFETTWHLFESPAVSGATPPQGSGFVPANKCRYLVLVPVHSDGDGGIKHWHMRYGSKSFEALTDNPSDPWWPTFSSLDTKAADIAKDQQAEAGALAAMMPKAFDAWNGEWISAAELHRNPLMAEAYRKVAEEAKKLGKNYTAEELKDYYQKLFATPFDRVVVADGTAIQFKKADGTVLAAPTYTNDGFAEDGWVAWINGTVAGYGTVVATHPHGDGAAKHWHMLYGDGKTAEELTKLSGWKPTFYDPKLTTPEAYLKSYVDGAARQAARLPEKK